MRPALVLALCGLVACNKPATGPDPRTYPEIVPGPPMVGAAEGYVEQPIGTPLAGYTHRCGCLTGYGRVDDRDSAYSDRFIESVGVHTTPTVKVIWIENGDQHFVWTKTDHIYSHDGIVEALEQRIGDRLGLDLDKKVVHATTHSHHSFGGFTQDKAFYLGSDRFNREIFERFITQVTDVAVEAYETREKAKIGIGWAKDWDPENRVYSDRRSENDTLKVWPDAEPGMGKDPYLAVMRFDRMDDTPIAIQFNFGIHGILLNDKNNLVSADATQGLESAIEEQFDEHVVVMHTQGGGGDASPRGTDDEYASTESVGYFATDAIMALWEQTPTSDAPVELESTGRHIPEHLTDIHITRNGEVDWYYAGYQGEDYLSDEQLYDENGEFIAPIDEFNTTYGSVFCGTGSFDLPVGGLLTNVFPFDQCMEVELMAVMIRSFFSLTEEEMPLPIPASLKAGVNMTRLGPIETLTETGKKKTQDLLMGFFPGEPTAMYTEQWRRRVPAELGYDHPLMVGYSMDHEGYLLIPEDWMQGEYEADIILWGPLQGEHIMERSIEMADELLSNDVHDDPDPWMRYVPTWYPETELPTAKPDKAPKAGTRLENATVPEYYYRPPLWDGWDPDLDVPATIERGTGQVQLGWIGGDPAVDYPRVVVERKDGNNWVELTSRSGRPVTSHMTDILLTHTSDPLYPAEDQQTHYYWAVWQAAAHGPDRLGLPEGTYRLKVDGQTYTGDATTWPWPSEGYTVTSEAFEVVPATLTIEPDLNAGGIWVSLPANPKGYRFLHPSGNSVGLNPPAGDFYVELAHTNFTVELPDQRPARYEGGKAWMTIDPNGANTVTVTDAHGNSGTAAVP